MPTLFLDAGALSIRLTVEIAVDTADGEGGAVRTWQALTDVWAKIEPMSATSQELAGHAGQVVTHRVYLRHRDDIAIGMRFTKGQRAFEIKALHDPDESRRYLVCLCEEAAP